MLIAYWIVAGLLAVAFIGAGGMKLARPRPALIASGMGFAEDFRDGQVKAIGAIEVLGALGLVLPMLTGVAPVLSPIAALGLAATMVVATLVHVRRAEPPVPTVVLTLLSLVAAVLGFLLVAR